MSLGIIVAVLLIIIAAQPSGFRVTRTMKMNVPASVVFAQVNDFHHWQDWSPWAKLDPAAKATYEGPSTGTGAQFVWAGNQDIGEGKMTIVESHPNDLIRIKLEFIKPFPGISTAEFTFKPIGDQTAVSWSMYGKKDFMAKAIGLVMNCNDMLGGQFDKGLTQMKTVAEAASAPTKK
jgi:hypothetical protein